MSRSRPGKGLTLAVIALSSVGMMFARAAQPYTQATVTRLENKVSYGKQQGSQAVTRPAVIQDTIKANSFLLSDSRSKAELQYVDGSIVRIGQNTVFSFEANSRTLALTKGMFIFYVPKGSGGTTIKTPSLVAGITGTVGQVTVNRIVILDGSVRLIPSRRAVVVGQFARKNPDGSITIDWFDKGKAPGGILSAVGAEVRKSLERDAWDLAKRQAKEDQGERKPGKPTPTSTPVPKHANATARTAGKEAAKNAAHHAAQTTTRSATTAAAAQAAAAASKAASKEASKKVSKEAAKPAAPHHMCFVAGTLVHTPSGVRKIEDLKVDDQVLSYDERTGKIEPAAVLRTWKSQRTDLVTLGTQDGSVTCSQNHRFYTADKGWLAANQLKPGDRIMKRNPAHPRRLHPAAACTVTAMKLKSPVNVYNLTVARNSNYFVGPDAVLCHNAK